MSTIRLAAFASERYESQPAQFDRRSRGLTVARLAKWDDRSTNPATDAESQVRIAPGRFDDRRNLRWPDPAHDGLSLKDEDGACCSIPSISPISSRSSCRSTGPLPHRPQNYLLLAASYYFYACWDARFLALLVLSTAMDYACGLAVDRIERPRKRKLFVALSMALNLGMLGYFKYFNFFAESLQAALDRAGVTCRPVAPERRPADRHLVLHVPVDELRHRRLPQGYQADAELRRVRGVRLVLPAPGGRPDHAADDAPAADREAADVSTSSSSIRGCT